MSLIVYHHIASFYKIKVDPPYCVKKS